jgi:hypothetical protein
MGKLISVPLVYYSCDIFSISYIYFILCACCAIREQIELNYQKYIK